MPGTNTPAVGVSSMASAQLMVRRNVVLRAEANFSDSEPVRLLAINTNGLSQVSVNLFLHPTYTELSETYAARNYIDWMPVVTVPGDVSPVVGTGFPPLNWISLTSPYILPVAVPINHCFQCGGAEWFSVAFRINPIFEPPVGQGVDLITVSISAAQ